ncbi:MAG: HD domain-containing protein [Nitrospira sp.]|nr:HD domain-containing protein [Nitrospira sp.]
MVRLTDLIRGAKAPPGTAEEAKPGADAAQEEKAASPAVAPPAPAVLPVQLRALKEQIQRQADPSVAVPAPPTPQAAPPAGPRTMALEAAILTAPPPAPMTSATPLTQPRTAVLELPPDLTGFTTQAAVSAASQVDWYGKAEAALAGIATAVSKQRALSLGDLPQIAEGLAESLAVDDRLLVRAISHQSGPSLIGNMVHVAIFGVKIGMGLGYRPDELAKLAFAALVHDIGMFQLPEAMLEETGRWTEEQVELLRRHPHTGSDLLKQAAKAHPWLPEIVLQEHERINGSGYPKGLQGPQIHEFALVIGLADVLDAMLRSRATRKALLPHEAVRLLLSREKSGFPTRLFKSLLQQFSLFPVGTWVKLTSGEIGEVFRSNPRFPLRPAVKIIIDQSGQRLREPKDLDLSGSPLVHVAEIVDALQLV